MNEFDMTGKTVIVTGASYGLGVSWASALADYGANIVATARNEDKLQETKALIEGKGRQCLTVGCDVREYDQVLSLIHI